MKTKSIILSLVAIVMFTTLTLAADPVNPKIVVVNQKQTGVFKIIYEGAQVGTVNMKIYDKAGKIVYTETIKNLNKFSQAVNFEGMKPGDYTIEISDNSGKATQTISYKNETLVNTVHVAKIAKEDKYLVALANGGEEEINVRIFDGVNNMIYDENMVVKGNFGLVFNLKQVQGTPTFEVTDKTGNVKTIKY